MRDVSVTIDGVTETDSVSTDRSNLMYGVGGEFTFNERFGVRLGWDRLRGRRLGRPDGRSRRHRTSDLRLGAGATATSGRQSPAADA